MKKAIVAIGVLMALIEGAWLIVLPESLIKGALEDPFDTEYVYLRSEGFKKGLFYNFSAAKLFLRKKSPSSETDTLLLEVDDLKGSFDLLSVLAFRPQLRLRCRLNDGEITGKVALTGRGNTDVSGGDIHMKDVPFLDALGIHAEGVLSGSFTSERDRGSLRISLGSAAFKNAMVGGAFLPLEVFHDVKGAATISDGIMEVQSLAMSGSGVYGRAKGMVKRGKMTLTFELMTEPSFKLEPLLQAMIERYKVSPGYYVFPMNGGISVGR